METKKVLVVTHEMDPYVKLTEQAQFARTLSQRIQEKGYEVRVFMPRFGKINERKHRLHEVIRLSGINIPIGEEDNPMIIKVASLPAARMQVYFIDNEDFFRRRYHFTDQEGNFFSDNDERMIFFNKGAIEILLKLGWLPDYIHCHGWMSSLVPVFARSVYKNEPAFRNSKMIFTPYNNGFEGNLGQNFLDKAHINGKIKGIKEFAENPNCTDLYKMGATFADGVTLGSPGINDELQKYVKTNSIKMLDYLNPELDEFIDKYQEFYQNLQE